MTRTSGTSPVCLVDLVCFVYLVCLVHLVSLMQPNKPDWPSFAAVERSMSDRFLRQRFEMWPARARLVNEGKQGRPAAECGAVHVLPEEMA